MPDQPDATVASYGLLYLLRPVSDAATAWTDTHLPDGSMRVGTAYVIEPRYIADIVRGMAEDGLAVANEP